MKTFLHHLKYELLTCLRTKELIFWLILFPVLLGAFFKVAFGDLYEKETEISAIPVAIVEQAENTAFRKVAEQMSEGEDALLSAAYVSEETALQQLEAKEVKAVIYVDTKLSMKVNMAAIDSYDVEQTIVERFLEQYRMNETIIVDTAVNHPEKLEQVTDTLSKKISINENIPLTKGNTDVTLQFFNNLIAMVALLGSTTGLHIAMNRQGNLSAIGARRCCTPSNGLSSLLAGLCGSYVTQAIFVCFSISYLAFVLKVDFGSGLPMMYFAGIIGGITAVSMGFFVGSIGRISEGAKDALTTSVSLACCFFSGLMASNMKATVQRVAPWFNEINPAALISDSFYCLQIYDDYRRFTEKLVVMLLMTAVFAAGGFLLTRRQKYASL